MGLVQGADGSFYGTAYSGGSADAGTVFKITPAGAFTTLISFGHTNGADPFATLLPGVDGNFYGTTEFGGTNDTGTAFEISPAGVFTTLVSFGGATNSSYPVAGLAAGADGYFYGTTTLGGSYNRGTIFRFPPLPNILSWKWASGAMIFTWSAAVGQTYQVQYKTNLNQTLWNSLVTKTATSSTGTNSDRTGSDQQRFYRVNL